MVQTLGNPGQVAAVEERIRRRAGRRGLAPGWADRLHPAIFDRVEQAIVGGLTIGEAVGEDLIEHAPDHPGGEGGVGQQTEVGGVGGHGRRRAFAVEPPYAVVGLDDEAIGHARLEDGQLGLPPRADGVRCGPAHRAKALLTVGEAAQKGAPDGGVDVDPQPQGDAFAEGRVQIRDEAIAAVVV